MRLGVLFSGGKDSTYALFKAMKTEEVVCLISILSKNEESYMFHTPNISITALQAQSLRIPLLQYVTEGVKEEELKDLRKAVEKAQNEYSIEGVVTGAVESVYQAERIQRICDALDLWCFNPLWLKDQEELLQEIIAHNFTVLITGIFAYPLDETWLGKKMTSETVTELMALKEKYDVSPSGEGGEIETTVLDAPFFEKRIHIQDFDIDMNKNSGVFIIKKAELVEK